MLRAGQMTPYTRLMMACTPLITPHTGQTPAHTRLIKPYTLLMRPHTLPVLLACELGFANQGRAHDFKGGASSAKNCEMLCITHNRAKGNR